MNHENGLYGTGHSTFPPLYDSEPPPLSPGDDSTVATSDLGLFGNFSSTTDKTTDTSEPDWAQFSQIQNDEFSWGTFSPTPYENNTDTVSDTKNVTAVDDPGLSTTNTVNQISSLSYGTQLVMSTISDDMICNESKKKDNTDESGFGLFYKDDNGNPSNENNYLDSKYKDDTIFVGNVEFNSKNNDGNLDFGDFADFDNAESVNDSGTKFANFASFSSSFNYTSVDQGIHSITPAKLCNDGVDLNHQCSPNKTDVVIETEKSRQNEEQPNNLQGESPSLKNLEAAKEKTKSTNQDFVKEEMKYITNSFSKKISDNKTSNELKKKNESESFPTELDQTNLNSLDDSLEKFQLKNEIQIPKSANEIAKSNSDNNSMISKISNKSESSFGGTFDNSIVNQFNLDNESLKVNHSDTVTVEMNESTSQHNTIDPDMQVFPSETEVSRVFPHRKSEENDLLYNNDNNGARTEHDSVNCLGFIGTQTIISRSAESDNHELQSFSDSKEMKTSDISASMTSLAIEKDLNDNNNEVYLNSESKDFGNFEAFDSGDTTANFDSENIDDSGKFCSIEGEKDAYHKETFKDKKELDSKDQVISSTQTDVNSISGNSFEKSQSVTEIIEANHELDKCGDFVPDFTMEIGERHEHISNEFGEFDTLENKESSNEYGYLKDSSVPSNGEFGDFGDFDSNLSVVIDEQNEGNSNEFNAFSSHEKSGDIDWEDFGDFDSNFPVCANPQDSKDSYEEFNDFSSQTCEDKTVDFGDLRQKNENNDFGAFGDFDSKVEIHESGWSSFTNNTESQDATVEKKSEKMLLVSEEIVSTCFPYLDPSEIGTITKLVIYDVNNYIGHVGEDDYESTIWEDLMTNDDDSRFTVKFFNSVIFQNQIASFNLKFQRIKSRHIAKLSHGRFTPTLSPSHSISSLEMSENLGILIPEQAVVQPPRNTLLAQSQSTKNPVERAGSLSSLKKGNDSETPSETASLDLDFFMSSGSGDFLSKDENKGSLSTLDLMNIDLSNSLKTEKEITEINSPPLPNIHFAPNGLDILTPALTATFSFNANNNISVPESNNKSAVDLQSFSNGKGSVVEADSSKISSYLPDRSISTPNATITVPGTASKGGSTFDVEKTFQNAKSEHQITIDVFNAFTSSEVSEKAELSLTPTKSSISSISSLEIVSSNYTTTEYNKDHMSNKNDTENMSIGFGNFGEANFDVTPNMKLADQNHKAAILAPETKTGDVKVFPKKTDLFEFGTVANSGNAAVCSDKINIDGSNKNDSLNEFEVFTQAETANPNELEKSHVSQPKQSTSSTSDFGDFESEFSCTKLNKTSTNIDFNSSVADNVNSVAAQGISADIGDFGQFDSVKLPDSGDINLNPSKIRNMNFPNFGSNFDLKNQDGTKKLTKNSSETNLTPPTILAPTHSQNLLKEIDRTKMAENLLNSFETTTPGLVNGGKSNTSFGDFAAIPSSENELTDVLQPVQPHNLTQEMKFNTKIDLNQKSCDKKQLGSDFPEFNVTSSNLSNAMNFQNFVNGPKETKALEITFGNFEKSLTPLNVDHCENNTLFGNFASFSSEEKIINDSNQPVQSIDLGAKWQFEMKNDATQSAKNKGTEENLFTLATSNFKSGTTLDLEQSLNDAASDKILPVQPLVGLAEPVISQQDKTQQVSQAGLFEPFESNENFKFGNFESALQNDPSINDPSDKYSAFRNIGNEDVSLDNFSSTLTKPATTFRDNHASELNISNTNDGFADFASFEETSKENNFGNFASFASENSMSNTVTTKARTSASVDAITNLTATPVNVNLFEWSNNIPEEKDSKPEHFPSPFSQPSLLESAQPYIFQSSTTTIVPSNTDNLLSMGNEKKAENFGANLDFKTEKERNFNEFASFPTTNTIVSLGPQAFASKFPDKTLDQGTEPSNVGKPNNESSFSNFADFTSFKSPTSSGITVTTTNAVSTSVNDISMTFGSSDDFGDFASFSDFNYSAKPTNVINNKVANNLSGKGNSLSGDLISQTLDIVQPSAETNKTVNLAEKDDFANFASFQGGMIDMPGSNLFTQHQSPYPSLTLQQKSVQQNAQFSRYSNNITGNTHTFQTANFGIPISCHSSSTTNQQFNAYQTSSLPNNNIHNSFALSNNMAGLQSPTYQQMPQTSQFSFQDTSNQSSVNYQNLGSDRRFNLSETGSRSQFSVNQYQQSVSGNTQTRFNNLQNSNFSNQNILSVRYPQNVLSSNMNPVSQTARPQYRQSGPDPFASLTLKSNVEQLSLKMSSKTYTKPKVKLNEMKPSHSDVSEGC